MAFTLILILALLIFLFIKKTNISMPSTMFCFIWILSILGAVFLLGGIYPLKYYGIYWIVALCFAISLASVHFENNYAILSQNATRTKNSVDDMPWLFIVICTMLSFLGLLINLSQNGLSLSVFGNLSSLSDVSYQMTVKRYSGSSTESALSQILGCFMMACGICSGYGIIYANTNRKKFICIFSVFPVILATLLTTAKLSLVSYILLFFTGYYISYINKYHQFPAINRKIFNEILLAIIAVFAAFYISFAFRLHGEATNTSSVIISKLVVYAFGHVQGFDLWFSGELGHIHALGYGANSLMAISSSLGIITKNQGIYTMISGSCTNVYSPFRGIIEDFGPVLGFVVEFLLFLFLEWILERLIISKNNSVILQTIAASQVFYFVFVFISYWVYTTYIVTFLIFAVFLFFAYRLKFTYKVKIKWKSR